MIGQIVNLPPLLSAAASRATVLGPEALVTRHLATIAARVGVRAADRPRRPACMSITLGPLLVEAADPAAAESFWARRARPTAQRALLTFRPQQRPKTVKNRVHLDVYVRDIAPLLDLGATVLGEYPGWVTLADVEDNEFCAFPDPRPTKVRLPASSPCAPTAPAGGPRGVVGRGGRR